MAREKAGIEMPKAKINRESLREMMILFAYLKPYKIKFILAFVFIALSALSTMIFPFLLGELIDTAGAKGVVTPMGESTKKLFEFLNVDPDALSWGLNTIIILIFVQLGVQMLFSYMRIFLLTEVGEKALGDMRKDVYSRLLLMPMGFFSERRVGELQSRVSADISQIQDTLTFTLAEFLRGVFTLIFGLALIFWISSRLALVMLAVVPLVAILAVFFGVKIRKMSRKTQDQLAESGTIMQETLQGIQVVKSFTNEKFEIDRYTKSIFSVVGTAIANGRFRGAFVSLLIFSVFGTVAFVMWYGAGMIQDNLLTVGDLTKFVVFSAFIGGTMAGFADMFSQLQKALGATQRVREILRDKTENINLGIRPENIRLRGAVEFDHVAFSYPHRQEIEVLKDISFHALPGEKIAIVGPSGAGKSTIASLLLRFYDEQKGKILFDGKGSRDYDLTYLRSQMALVPQDVQLFGGTILENIVYGKPGSSEEMVKIAARKAHAHEFIMSFPDQYQTVVGERGIKLSGGQRQRIAIARAILHDPAILILDEATSSLDSESEKLVQEALEELMKGRTSLIIAHRLSTIRNADKIVVIDKGIVLESGRHTELMENRDGLYHKLSTLQLEFVSGPPAASLANAEEIGTTDTDI
jgi:ABC-type multidrug transport system fused ATPase/permease subunit